MSARTLLVQAIVRYPAHESKLGDIETWRHRGFELEDSNEVLGLHSIHARAGCAGPAL
jgi:hypothetical protein